MAGISPQTSSSLRTALPASADASSSSSSLLQPRAVRPPLPSGPKTHSSSSNSATQTHNQRQDDDDEGAFEIGRGSSPTASVAASSSAASTPQRTPATAMAPTDEGGPDDGPPRTTHLTAAAIKALSLADADGVKGALRLVGLLAADDRLLQAAALWARVQERVAATVAEGGDGDGRVKGLVDAYVADDPARAACLAGLEARAEEARAAMADLEDMSGWAFDHSLLGVATYRRYEGGLLHIMVSTLIDRQKVDGLSCFEPIAVLKEAGHYHRWSPYCTRNAVVRSYDGKGDLLLFLLFNLRVIRREIFLKINIVDDSLDAARLLILGRSVPRDFAEAEATAAAAGGGGGSLPPQCYQDCPPMHFPSIRALISHPDERHVQVRIAVKIDMNTSIPRAVVDFAIRRFFQVLIHLIVRAAKAAVAHPADNVHAQLIRADPFYRRFLLPKYRAMCARYGWACPGVPALDIEEGPQEGPQGQEQPADAVDALLAAAVFGGAGGCGGQGEDARLSSLSSSSSSSSSLGGRKDADGMGKTKKQQKPRRLRPRKHARRLAATLKRAVSGEWGGTSKQETREGVRIAEPPPSPPPSPPSSVPWPPLPVVSVPDAVREASAAAVAVGEDEGAVHDLKGSGVGLGVWAALAVGVGLVVVALAVVGGLMD